MLPFLEYVYHLTDAGEFLVAHDSSGKNIVRFLKRNPESTRLRFDELKDRSEIDLSDEVSEDVQAAKLMVAFDYMKLRQSQLRDQLEELEAWVVS